MWYGTEYGVPPGSNLLTNVSALADVVYIFARWERGRGQRGGRKELESDIIFVVV